MIEKHTHLDNDDDYYCGRNDDENNNIHIAVEKQMKTGG
jgi:hypothetical protein